MTPQMISLIISAFAGVLMILPFLWGAVRGLKKSTFRFVWTVVLGIACFVFSGLIAKALVNFDISFLNLTANGTTAKTFPQYLQLMLEEQNSDMGAMIADNPEIIELCVTIATTMIRLVVFELSFWLTKWLLWPIWAIIAHIVFGKNKNKEARSDEQHDIIGRKKKVVKPKKHGFYGALVGLAMGIFVVLCTFIPLAGISNILLTIDKEIQVERDGEKVGIISNALGENSAYLTVYEDSYIAKGFKYTGIEFVQNKMFVVLTSSNFNGYNISVAGEINKFAPLYSDYNTVKEMDFNNLSKEDINTLLDIGDRAQKIFFSSEMLKSVYDEVVPNLAKSLVTNEYSSLQLPDLNNPILNDMVENIIRAFFGITDDNQIDESKIINLNHVSEDVSKMINIAKNVNNTGLILDAMNGNLTFEKMQEKVTVELGDLILDDVLDLNILSRLLSAVVEPMIHYGINQIPAIEFDGTTTSVQYVTVDGGLTYNNFKEFAKKLVSNGILVFRNIDTESTLYVSPDNFANLGKVIDILTETNMLSSTTFDSLINYGTTFAKSKISTLGYDEEITNILNSFVDSVAEIDSYEAEFGYIGNAYKKYENAGGVIDVELVTKMLDEMVPSVLYTENIDCIISNGTTYLTRMINNSGLPITVNDLDVVLEKIGDVESFHAEYLIIKDLYDRIASIAQEASPFEELIKEENLTYIGEQLDTIKDSSVLIDDESCQIIIKNLIDSVELPTEFVSYKAQLKTNVASIESYEDELTKVAKIFDIMDIQADTSLTDTQKLVAIGEIIDQIKTGKLFDNVVVPMVKDMAKDKLDEITGVPANVIAVIKSAVDNISVGMTFKNEFEYMMNFAENANFADVADFKTYLTANAPKNLLNSDGESNSDILTTDVLYDLMIAMVDNNVINMSGVNIKANIQSALTTDKTNNVNILDTLTQIEDLVDEVAGINTIPNSSSINRAYLESLGQEIDGLIDYDLILDADAVDAIGDYVTDSLYDALDSAAKAQVQSVYEAKDTYSSYSALFTAFANAMGM